MSRRVVITYQNRTVVLPRPGESAVANRAARARDAAEAAQAAVLALRRALEGYADAGDLAVMGALQAYADSRFDAFSHQLPTQLDFGIPRHSGLLALLA